jgi:uncharacterized membrane protein YkgB
MDKQQTIAFIQGQLAMGQITKEDLSVIIGNSNSTPVTIPSHPKEQTSSNLIHVLYSIGAIIAIVGVGILVFQNWDTIGLIGRLLVTLGISFATYSIGLLMRRPDQKTLSQIMFTISATLAPLGSYVLLHEAAITFTSLTQFVTAIILTAIFGTALIISRKNILTLITAGMATWAYYAILIKIFGFSYNNFDLLKLATILIGVSYIFIAYSLKASSTNGDTQDRDEKKRSANILYGFGTLAILGAGISISGIFDLFFIALIFGAFYGSVFLKSRAMLLFAALFLVSHIFKLTSKYFVHSIGWPVALIGIGFLVIGIGYMTFYLNRKFISDGNQTA